jgi:hypothetical protein
VAGPGATRTAEKEVRVPPLADDSAVLVVVEERPWLS